MKGVSALLAALLPVIAYAQGWSVFKSDRFGFSMLVAPGTSWEARDLGDGWGSIRTQTGVMQFVAIVKLGHFGTAEELETAAVQWTQVPGPLWRKTDEGKKRNGWKWWRTYEARNDSLGLVLYAVLGTGRRGSYVLFVQTAQADFQANQALYAQWYESLTLY